MNYLLLIYTDENTWTDDERQACYAESIALTHDLQKEGKYRGGGRIAERRPSTRWPPRPAFACGKGSDS